MNETENTIEAEDNIQNEDIIEAEDKNETEEKKIKKKKEEPKDPAREDYNRKKRFNELCWYALFVTSQHEKQLMESFTGIPDKEVRKSIKLPPLSPPIEAFIPTRKEKRKWSDRVRTVTVVLAPGVIFVRIRLTEKQRLYNSPYVSHFLFDRTKKEPARIPDGVMERFRSSIEEGRMVLLRTPKVGEKVLIVGGKFEGLVGEVIQADSDDVAAFDAAEQGQADAAAQTDRFTEAMKKQNKKKQEEKKKRFFQLRLIDGLSAVYRIEEEFIQVIEEKVPEKSQAEKEEEERKQKAKDKKKAEARARRLARKEAEREAKKS